MAWYTRGDTRMTRFRNPNVERAIPAVMNVRPSDMDPKEEKMAGTPSSIQSSC
jgi:hypothetical protein